MGYTTYITLLPSRAQKQWSFTRVKVSLKGHNTRLALAFSCAKYISFTKSIHV